MSAINIDKRFPVRVYGVEVEGKCCQSSKFALEFRDIQKHQQMNHNDSEHFNWNISSKSK